MACSGILRRRLAVSGQTALEDQGNLVGIGDFDRQADHVFKNVDKVFQAGRSSLTKVVKVTIFLGNMKANFTKIVALREQYFTAPYPADTIVEISSLYSPDALLEIEAVAVAGFGGFNS